MEYEVLVKALAEQFGVNEDSITTDTSLTEDLGADSLDIVEMLMTLEEEYGVSIPDEKIGQVKTIAEIVEMLEECQK